MDKCIYCFKKYTERGIGLHIKSCKKKIIKNENKNVITILDDDVKNIGINKLNIDLLRYIYSFYEEPYDKFCTYKRYLNSIFNISYVSKYFYKTFMIGREKLLLFKGLYYEQCGKFICKSTAKNEYNLKENDLEYHIHYKMVKNPYYSSSSAMKLYKLTDILDFLYYKYGNEKNYELLLNEEIEKKELAKEKSEILKTKRKINYDNLFQKYNLGINHIIYQKFLSYVNSGTPGVKKIEKEIIDYIEKDGRKSNLLTLLQQNNIVYRETSVLKEYIEGTKDIFDAYNSITETWIRENKLKDAFENNGLIFNEYVNNEKKEEEMINFYIFENKYTINEIINTIIGKEERKRELKTKLELHGLKLRNDSELCWNYIEYNDGDLDYIVDTMIEMDFYYKFTNYQSFYKKCKYDLYDDDYISISYEAKKMALKSWCKKIGNYEDVIKVSYFPKSLYNNAFKIFYNKI